MNSIPFLSNYLEMGNQEYHRGFESSDVLSLVYLFNFVLCIEVTVCVCVCVSAPLPSYRQIFILCKIHK